jgi:hypothetical protein
LTRYKASVQVLTEIQTGKRYPRAEEPEEWDRERAGYRFPSCVARDGAAEPAKILNLPTKLILLSILGRSQDTQIEFTATRLGQSLYEEPVKPEAAVLRCRAKLRIHASRGLLGLKWCG